jgi:hypothetical protein
VPDRDGHFVDRKAKDENPGTGALRRPAAACAVFG